MNSLKGLLKLTTAVLMNLENYGCFKMEEFTICLPTAPTQTVISQVTRQAAQSSPYSRVALQQYLGVIFGGQDIMLLVL